MKKQNMQIGIKYRRLVLEKPICDIVFCVRMFLSSVFVTCDFYVLTFCV